MCEYELKTKSATVFAYLIGHSVVQLRRRHKAQLSHFLVGLLHIVGATCVPTLGLVHCRF